MQSILGTARVGFHVSINGGDDVCRSSRLDLWLLLVLVQQLTSSRAPRHTIKSRAELALITAYGVRSTSSKVTYYVLLVLRITKHADHSASSVLVHSNTTRDHYNTRI